LVLASAYKINRSCPLALPVYFHALTGNDIDEPERFHRVSSRQLFRELQEINDDFLIANGNILSEALREAGANGNIAVQGTSSLDSELMIEEGYKTLFRLHDFFIPHIHDMTMPDCSIIVVDGAIIEVSEIHHVLQHSYDTKENVLILSRNISDDVANTLLVNWQQGKTNVFSGILKDEVESLNEIKDVCELVGVTPVSNQTGILISTIDFKDVPRSDVAYSLEKDQLRIKIGSDRARICSSLREKLRQQIEKENVPDVRDVLEKRMSRMSSRTVTVRINFSESEKGLVQDKASIFFTYFSKCAQQGVVYLDDDFPVKLLPGLEVIKAIKAAKADKSAIENVKAVLGLDE